MMNDFKRGLDPKEAMGIGRASILKEINGKIINEKEYKTWKKFRSIDYSENVIILVTNGTYRIVKNIIRSSDSIHEAWLPLPKGLEGELYDILVKLQDNFRKYGCDWFSMPIMQKVSARTIGLDLVSVQPMSAPIGTLNHLNYTYKVTPKQKQKQNKKWGF
jgi:hypothetical protein